MTAFQTIAGFQVSDRVLDAVHEASRRTGTDFGYMMAKAATESAFQPEARAATSNATGLYQFINSTWIAMVHRYGDRYGLDRYAAQISEGPGGALTVADSAARRAILDLRNDPTLSALMAGEYANENRAHLESALGTRVGPTELYMAHFLGAHGGARFLSTLRQAPGTSGAALFPAAAEANRPAFYDRSTGRALTVQEIYDAFDRRTRRTMAMVGESVGLHRQVASVAHAPHPSAPPAPLQTGNEVPGGHGYFAARPAPASFFADAAGAASRPGGWAHAGQSGVPVARANASAHPASAHGPGPSGEAAEPAPGGRSLSLWTVLMASS